MIFFGDLENKSLSEKIAKQLKCEVQYADVHIFPDGERRVRILHDVVDETVIVLKSFADPVDSNLMEFLFLIDAIHRSGAKNITAIIPYLAYQRADHVFRTGEPVPLEVVIRMIEAAGIDEVIVLEPHSIKLPEMFHIPVTLVSAIPLFAEKVKEMEIPASNLSVVSPDMGGIRRIKQMAQLLGNCAYVAINKERDLEKGNVMATHHEGDIKPACVIADDICSTGSTLVNAIDYLLQHGANTVYVMVTHPVLAGNSSQMLQDSSAVKVFMTDSIEIPEHKVFEKLEIISISNLLSQSLNSK